MTACWQRSELADQLAQLLNVLFAARQSAAERFKCPLLPLNSGYDPDCLGTFAAENLMLNYVADPRTDRLAVVGRQILDPLNDPGTEPDRHMSSQPPWLLSPLLARSL